MRRGIHAGASAFVARPQRCCRVLFEKFRISGGYTLIPHSRPIFDAASAQALARVLESGVVACGPRAEELEARVCRLIGQSFATAVDSGTSALLLALFALGTQRRIRRVGIPAYACRALLHAVRAAGCEPVLMDCDDDLRLRRDAALALADSLDVVILVHPFGFVEPLVAEDWPCPVIEDIAQGAGGRLDGKPLGGFGDVCVASFYATKPWGGAFGGMAASDDEAICSAVRAMRCADTADLGLPYAGNHQLSDVHAVLALARLDVADAEREARKRLSERYDEWLKASGASIVRRDADGNHYRYIVRVGDAGKVIARLREHGVGAARPVATPLSRLLKTDAPGAESAWQTCVSLPLLSAMSDTEEALIQEALNACM